MSSHAAVTYRPIGIIRTPYTDNTVRIPHGNTEIIPGEFKIILDAKYEPALYGLDTFQYIYVIFHLDKVRPGDYSNRVFPPHFPGVETGLFASRSPRRPNPIGISIVKIGEINGNTISISPVDAYDNTPLLDIKPYFQQSDAKYNAGNGWATPFLEK